MPDQHDRQEQRPAARLLGPPRREVVHGFRLERSALLGGRRDIGARRPHDFFHLRRRHHRRIHDHGIHDFRWRASARFGWLVRLRWFVRGGLAGPGRLRWRDGWGRRFRQRWRRCFLLHRAHGEDLSAFQVWAPHRLPVQIALQIEAGFAVRALSDNRHWCAS